MKVGAAGEKEKQEIARVIAEGKVNEIADKVMEAKAELALRFSVTGEEPEIKFSFFGFSSTSVSIDQKYALQTDFLKQEGLIECTNNRLSTCLANDLGRRVHSIIETRKDARRKELQKKQNEEKKLIEDRKLPKAIMLPKN